MKNLSVWLLLAGSIAVSVFAGPVRADDKFALKAGERVVFFGDSITQGGHYIGYVEAYLLARFPDKRFTLINHGISSETISGTSEIDHNPRRPHALPRFTRDIVEWKPTVIVACFGMNDGNYHPFDEERFGLFQKGVGTLLARTRQETKAEITLLTPPPFDPYRRKAGDPKAVHFGYKYPAIDYDQTLARYSQWLGTLREKEGIRVVDLHTAMNDHLRKRREERVSFFLSDDAVHPNATGHWLMAQAILAAWNAPTASQTIRASIKSGKAAVDDQEPREITRADNGITIRWLGRLPMPVPPQWDPRSLELEKFAERFTRNALIVTDLPGARYRLLAGVGGEEKTADLGVFSKEQLASGVDLTSFAQFPTVALSQTMLTALASHRKAEYDEWRAQIAGSKKFESPDALLEAFDAGHEKVRTLAQPKELYVLLKNEL